MKSLYGDLAVCPDNLPGVTPEMTERGVSAKVSNDWNTEFPILGSGDETTTEQQRLVCPSIGMIAIVQAAE